MTLPTASQFRQHLVSFIDYYANLEPVDPGRLQQGELRSEVMFKEDKKYHIDLKVRARQNAGQLQGMSYVAVNRGLRQTN